MAESDQGTDWRVDKDGEVHNGRNRCRYGWPGHPDCTPVLVVPVGEARETIARAITDAALDSDGYAGPSDLADAVIAALAATPPETEETGHRKGYIPEDPSPVCLTCRDPWPRELAPVSEGGRGDG